ncbi:MAG: class I SAM-dependent methyltransferase [Melioribacteraceae bacterium]|nr:class I SAM-dependent methyltransferase [Melioribacteraceae bacterium]
MTYFKYLFREVYQNLFKKELHNPDVSHNGLEFEIRNDVICRFILNRLIPIVGLRPYPLNELNLMVASVCFLKPEIIFEWGTNIGKSARIFHEICKYFHIDSTIHTIDLPDEIHHQEHPSNRRGYYIRSIKSVKMYQGDGVTTALDIFKSSKKDNPLFFLDGDHEYESVRRELQLIHESVISPKILIHDTFYQSKEAGYNIGPYLAIEDFLKNVPNIYRRIDAHLGTPGITLLFKNLNRNHC